MSETHDLKLTQSEIEVLHETLSNCKHFPDVADPVETSLFVKVVNLYEDVCVEYGISPACRAFYNTFGYYPTGENDRPFWELFRKAFNLRHGISND